MNLLPIVDAASRPQVIQDCPVSVHDCALVQVSVRTGRQSRRDVHFEHLGEQLLRVVFFRSHSIASRRLSRNATVAGRVSGHKPGRGHSSGEAHDG